MNILIKQFKFKLPCIYRSMVNSTVLTYSEFGDPGKVVQKSFEKLSAPQNSEVLIKMLAAPINPADINVIQGKYPVHTELPSVPGNECVAEVLQVGSATKSLKVGDKVVAFRSGLGTWRTHAVFQESDLLQVPNQIDNAAAATLTVNPCTAYRMLRDFEDLKPGDTVIQNGANSACGQIVFQLCRAYKLNSVGIVRNRPDILELSNYLKGLGATEILTEEQCRATQLFKSKQLKKPKLAFNCVGGKNALEMMKHLDHAGTMVTYGGMSREPVTVPTAALIFKDLKIRGFWMTRWKQENPTKELCQAMINDLFTLLQEGHLQSAAYTMVPFENYQEALASSLKMEGFSGKKILLQF